MGEFKPMSPDGLVEGVGQELEPCGRPADNTSPIVPKTGQWSFRFNYEKSTKLLMLVDVTFTNPFPMAAELCSEMDESQVENLRDWLSRILDVMNGRPAVDYFTPTSGRVGEKVTIIGKNFSDPVVITFGASRTPATFEFISDIQVVAVVPHDAETGHITVRNSRGAGSSAEIFTVQ